MVVNLIITLIITLIININRITGQYYLQTIAGNGMGSSTGDNGPASLATLNYPINLWGDTTGVLYIAENSGYRIRKISQSGIITAFIGTGTNSNAGSSGPATSTEIGAAYGVYGDSNNEYLYFSDYYFVWRYVFATGMVARYAGAVPANYGFSGDGGQATSAQLNYAAGLFLSTGGSLYIADSANNCIRWINTMNGVINTFAGSGVAGFAGDGFQASSAEFSNPEAVWGNTVGVIYIADTLNNRIRMVNTNGIVSTFAGATVTDPTDVKGDSNGMIYVAEYHGCMIQSITAGIINTVIGTGTCTEPTTMTQLAADATMDGTQGIWIENNDIILFTEPTNYLRKLYNGSPTSQPTSLPSSQPSERPSDQPTKRPTGQPTKQPNSHPTTQPTSRPSSQPSEQPSSQPTSRPTGQPTFSPTSHPTTQPTSRPSTQPSEQPSSQPTSRPTGQPTFSPTLHPTTQPTSRPSTQPSEQPSSQPTSRPTGQPTFSPTSHPTTQPTSRPSTQPIEQPSSQPTSRPTGQPTFSPTSHPTTQPTSRPSTQPSEQPSSQLTSRPTGQPTFSPTSHPTTQPTSRPSTQPSEQPSSQPTSRPTGQPTFSPTSHPTTQSTSRPLSQPIEQPSSQLTSRPTGQPTFSPTSHLTTQPTSRPSSQPSERPSSEPTTHPTSKTSRQSSKMPSIQPTNRTTGKPTMQPTSHPTQQSIIRASKSQLPSGEPTSAQTGLPNLLPTSHPTTQLTSAPLSQPSVKPSGLPSNRPTWKPSVPPTGHPTTQETTGYFSEKPSGQMSNEPSMIQSSERPSNQPTSSPTGKPSRQPTSHPTSRPTLEPVSQPSERPLYLPKSQPTIKPIIQPTQVSLPTGTPSIQPTSCRTSFPSLLPFPPRSSQSTSQPAVTPTSLIIPRDWKEVLFLVGVSVVSSVNETLQPIELMNPNDGPGFILFGGRSLSAKGSINVTFPKNDLIAEWPKTYRRDAVSRCALIPGDLNQDGQNDLFLCSPILSQCFIFYGVEEEEEFVKEKIGSTVYGTTSSDYFGFSLASVGDMNEDGVLDMIVCALSKKTCYVLYGGSSFPTKMMISEIIAEEGYQIVGDSADIALVGMSVTGLGDMNDDGYNDIAISVMTSVSSRSNVVYVIYGNGEGEEVLLSAVGNGIGGFQITGQAGYYTGFSISGVGDMNEDGLADIAIGQLPYPGTKNTQSSIIIFGSREGGDVLLSSYSEELGRVLSVEGGGGFIVSGIGDINHDGIADVLLSASYDYVGESNAYIVTYPTNITSPPTLQPSSSPSTQPSNRPSVRPSTLFPSLFFSLNPSVSLAPSLRNATSMPTKRPSYRPSRQTRTPTELPSFQLTLHASVARSICPSLFPSFFHTKSPTHRPSSQPSITQLPSSRPSTLPSSISQDNNEVIIILKEGQYVGPYEVKEEVVFEVKSSGMIEIEGGRGEAGNIYVIYPPSAAGNKTVVIISNFNIERDIIDLQNFPTLQNVNEISFSDHPLTMNLTKNVKVICSSLATTHPNQLHLIFATDSSPMNSSMESEVVSVFSNWVIIFIIVAILFCSVFVWVCGGSNNTRNYEGIPNENAKEKGEVLLINPVDDNIVEGSRLEVLPKRPNKGFESLQGNISNSSSSNSSSSHSSSSCSSEKDLSFISF